MSTVAVGGARLAYDEAGSGPTVVFVHAGCADRRMWEHQFHALADTYRVIRYDWRGYGGSTDADGDFAYHEDLLALLDALDVPEAALVGASDGGRTALDAALAEPGRIAALALAAPGLSGHEWPPSMLERYRRRVHDVLGADRLSAYRRGEVAEIDETELAVYARAETEFLVAGPDRSWRDLPAEVWRLALAMDTDLNRRHWSRPQRPGKLLRPPAKERLAEVTVPTLVVRGLADVPEIQEVSVLLAERIPGARRVDLPGTGHLPPLERPEDVTAALRAFLPRG
ncbi:pimeloyl-ACP methyl ester carboxylesterase [Prauserella shujinwangii]|uniref:Pimeloyl-ACP methyl ester carboxylesterase n=1 Tax=Prauserella shujinwangii TaxID=1453103 RepID=A0A2T0LMF3_9PSEU|nr:alpha/beta hydrolase [Prauserella shujinwangii]PRX44220.1 pimeloyl-ACP methyl ester carboxylesterase [Prauserella shujinwangii]